MVSTENYSLIDIKDAYTAGIIDGEGSISLSVDGEAFKGVVIVDSTTQELVEWLRKEMGGGCYKLKQRKNRKQQHRWRLYGKRAAMLLQRLYPYLIVKKKHAKIYCKFYLTMGGWEGILPRLDEVTVAEREALISEMHELNKRGVSDETLSK